ncbi:MAG: nucleotide pyrophosphohydrolase [Cytophagales bacterium]|nr:nucleotide pyrophosphohydrolase [Cytophagales bacterium]
MSLLLQEIQARVDQWVQTQGVRYFDPMTNMVLLSEEIGELARLMAREYGEQSYKAGERRGKEAIIDEMADVLWVLICLANQMGISLTQAFEANLKKKLNRDAVRHQQNFKLRPRQEN